MKVGVLSDIHLKRDDGRIRSIIDNYLSDIDIIFLCGDLTSMEIFNTFSDKKVFAVSGNMDDNEVKGNLPIKRVVELDGIKFGIMHGYGPPIGIEERIVKEFEDVDCIVFGHTHSAVNEKKGDIVFFNPGSPTDKRFASYNSIGIIEITDGGIDCKIIQI